MAGSALVLGGAGATFLHIGTASGTSTDPICTLSSGTLSIDLLGGNVTISDDGTNFVVTPSTSCTGPYAVSATSAITFKVDSQAAGSSTIHLDQTDHEFPCVAIGGTVGNTTAGLGSVDVLGADGENLTVGSSGINLAPGTCDSSVGTLTGVASYALDDSANTGAVTLSATGGSGTGSAAAEAATLTSGGAANTFVAGIGTETFVQTGTGVGDSIDFSNVPTSSTVPLTVNVSGAIGNDTAAVGSATQYTFTTGGAAFTNFTSASTGYTTYLAGGTGGYSFSGGSSTDAADFSTASTGITVNLSPAVVGTLQTGDVAVSSGVDTITGLNNVTGSTAGGNVFYAGSGGPYLFTGNGNVNTFTGGAGKDLFQSNGTHNRYVAGTGEGVFVDSTSGNTVDFSALTVPLTVNDSTTTVGTTAPSTATTASTTYTFSLTAPTTYIGATPASGGTTFIAGSHADTFEGQGLAGDTLSYAHTSAASLTICTAKLASGACASVPNGSTGAAMLNGVTEPFSGIDVLDGLTGGNTSFVSGTTGGCTFNANSSGNTADFAAATAGVDVDLSTSPATVTGFTSGGADDMNGIASVTGSTAGGNTFTAGTGNETFTQTGSGVGDAVDFTNLAASSAQPLAVNVTGGPVGTLQSDRASFGSALYSFNGAGAFTTFTGSSKGFTTFLAGGDGGYGFSDVGSSNVVDFSAATSGVTVNLSAAAVGTLKAGEVAVPGGVDTISGIDTVTGSSAGGNTFYAGASGPYDFTSAGDGNVFVGGAGDDTFAGTGSGNRFVAGAGNALIDDTTASNTIDFSALTVPVTVNATSTLVGVTKPGTATTSSATYDFGGVVAPVTFVGATPASGGTTFDAGADADTFEGQGLGGDTLSYASAPGTSLTVCMAKLTSGTCAAVPAGATGAAVLSGVTEPFSGIAVVDGLPGGNTTFVAGTSGGNSFNGSGQTNTLDLSHASAGIVVTVNGDSLANPGTVSNLHSGVGSATVDTFSGIESFTGAPSIVSPVTVQPLALGPMAVGLPFRQQLAGAGGVAPYGSWVVESGSLPLGLSLSSTGVLSGTPTASGPVTFVITVLDAHGIPGATGYTVTVAPPHFVIRRLPDAVAGSPYSEVIRVSGGMAPYRFALISGALPPGLTLDRATGVVAGTPRVTGLFVFTISVTDSSTGTGPYTVTHTFTLRVLPA